MALKSVSMRLIRAASAGSASRALTRCSRSLGSSNRYFGVSRQLLKSSLNRNAGALLLGVDVPRGCVAAQRVPPLQDSLDNRRITMVGLDDCGDVAVLGPPNEEGAAGMLGNPLTQVVRPPVVNPHV